MAGELSVRRYRPADAGAVWAVHEAALRASPLPFVEDAAADADVTEIEARYLDAGGEFLVGEVAGDGSNPDGVGSIVAIGGFQPVDDATAELRRMRVHPDHQCRGYATAVLVELEDRARAAGFERIELETVEHLAAARALYREHGYAIGAREAHPETGDELLTFTKSV